jgi:hypothetical protein
MSFDQSRTNASPWRSWRDFFGVVMQQGRVQLDSDWNEWLAEIARRIQAGTLDILGLAGVPSTTPFGFKVNAFVSGTTPHVTIGAGRIYMDGLLVENHGPLPAPPWNPVNSEWSEPPQAPIAWDPALGEWSGAPQIPGVTEADVDYTQQPYLPGALLPSGNGPFLVYLDVWQREVSALQDPGLVEKAVGVDTTGRLQTVWQVKLLDISSVSGVTCSTPDTSIGPWESIIQPSSSQLSNGLVQLAPSGNCALTPAASYTGLENQLYRIEIHQPGIASAAIPASPLPAGTATFKWSRENASVATAVTGISTVTNSAGNNASQLTVQSLGRDQVLGFNPGDWIEIADDYLELNFQQLNSAGLPGEMHQIVSIDPTAKTIVLDSTVSATNFPVQSGGATYPYRHTRIRRWDQKGTVYLSDGATPWFDLDSPLGGGATAGSVGIPVPSAGTSVLLEDGIVVSFPEGNAFRPGEYWTFAARSSDGSVETLTNAPPAGTLHHYCRLGIVNFTASPPTVTDCRRVFPSLANPSIHVTQVVVGGVPLVNNGTVSIQSLLKSGITVSFDAPLSPSIIATTTSASAPNYPYPLCGVTVELPAAGGSGAFNPFVLPAWLTVGSETTPMSSPPTNPPAAAPSPLPTVAANSLQWTPVTTLTTLEGQFSTAVPYLARMTLKGNLIWAQGNESIYLNGAGDGRTSADFDMAFWLISQPAVTLSTTNLVFATPQAVGTSITQSVTLTNNTNATSTPTALTITAITISGANAADFTTPAISAATPVTVAAGASYTFTVTFDPQAAGSRSATLSIAGTVSTQVPQTVNLSGIAIQPAVSASVSSLIFPSTIVGAKSAQQALILTNTGTSQLTIASLSITPNYSWSSSNLTSTGSGTVQPGAQCTIQVQFAPTAAGSIAGSLVIANNSSISSLTIPLSGTAVAGTPGISPSPASVSFGTINEGASLTATVTITSSGTSPLVITGVSVAGTGFALAGNTCSTIAPTAQCTIQVRFTPPGATTYTGTLTITHNAAGSPLNIPLSGSGRTVKGKEIKEIKEAISDTKAIEIEKVSDVINKLPINAKDIAEEPAGASGTASPFIAPEERPAVGPQSAGQPGPNEEPPGEEPKE